MRSNGHINSLPTVLLGIFLNIEETFITNIRYEQVQSRTTKLKCSVGRKKGLLGLVQTAKAVSVVKPFDPNNRYKLMKCKIQTK